MEYSHIALAISTAAVFGGIAKIFKQPLIIGYILSGFLLGVFGVFENSIFLEELGKIGVALLLFLLGLEMNLKELSQLGKTSLLTGIGQIFFTSVVGFIISLALGIEALPSVYIAIALTFSSTIIMIKLLSEKKDLSSLYGRISVGFLLVQDFVAILIIVLLGSISKDQDLGGQLFFITIKALLLIFAVFLVSKKILPGIIEKITANSHELLFIISIAWVLGLSAFIAGPLGFTLEIGGFIAGIALSGLPEHLQIASKTKPLRDFFLTIFFVILGTKLLISGSFLSIIFPAIIFSLFVLLGNPIIVLIILGFLGYKKRTSFMSGLTVAQISEFSLILMSMGLSLGYVTDRHLAIVVMVGVITMTVSTYMILNADLIYLKLDKFLKIFEKKNPKEKILNVAKKRENHIILVGCDRTGRVLADYVIRKKMPFVVVDFDPTVHKRLFSEGVDVIFGDINDPDVLAGLNMKKAKLLISTTSNLLDNLTLLEFIKTNNIKLRTMFTANTKKEAITLYEKGATYVSVPEIAAGDHLKHLLIFYRKKNMEKIGENHFKRLLYL